MTDPAAPGARLRFGMEGATRFLSSRAAPILFGCLTALEVAFLWGTISPVATIHDEAAYLFQAKVFATGRWTAPAPPLPEFFEQFHVLVTPVFAGKYPPGHSLLLVPGIWLGASGLMPCVLAGIAGGLLYLLARRFANPWAALLTWLIWTTSPGNLRYLPSYLSQSTTVALWLLGWWALAQWLQGKGTRWLMLLFSAAAWGALTRPFTFVGYAAASGFVVVREIAKRRAWGELARALVPAAAILGILPLWNARTTGDVRLTPYVLYLKTYFPAQGLGFGLPADRQPKRALPRDMILYDWEFLAVHEAYTLASVPKQLLLRVLGILGNSWDDWRWPLSFFFFLGLRERPREGLFALATGALLLISHIPFAHPWGWSLYYFELQGPFAFVTALGLWAAISSVAVRPRQERRITAGAVTSQAALGTALLVLIAAGPLCLDVERYHRKHSATMAYHAHFRDLVASIPETRAIVFVRYGASHDINQSLIANEPDLERAKAWIVYDRGPDNMRLLRAAPDRAPYLYDESTARLTRLQTAT